MNNSVNVEIRIMGIKSRQDNIKKLQKKLSISDDNVVYANESIRNPYDTCKRAFTKEPSSEDITHILVIQDDIEVCNKFESIVETIVSQFPEAIWNFFNNKFNDRTEYNYFYFTKDYEPIFSCQAVCMPVDFAQRCFAWCDKNLDDFSRFSDDGSIKLFALTNKIRMIGTTVPLVQHLVDKYPSTLGNGKSKELVSKLYSKTLPGKVDWSAKTFDDSRLLNIKLSGNSLK